MNLYTTQPIEEINNKRFKTIIKYKEIIISTHAHDHLSDRQRKVFKEEELLQTLKKETPRKLFLQKNGRYAVYYRKTKYFQKLIVGIEKYKLTIITFMDVVEIPKIRMRK